MPSFVLLAAFAVGVLLAFPGLIAALVLVSAPHEPPGAWIVLAGSTVLSAIPLVVAWRRMAPRLRFGALALAGVELCLAYWGVLKFLSMVDCR